MTAPVPTAAKIATLEHLAAAGLPVPAFVALADARAPDPATWARIDELLAAGPVIVRAALPGEDTAHASGAGLGTSIAGCRSRADVLAALATITIALRDPWLLDYFSRKDPPPQAQALVQRQICGPWLAVVAQGHVRHVELHRRDPRHDEPLAAGLSPALAGPLDLFPADLRAAIAPLCDLITAALPTATHGLDLELVADHSGEVWVVQARPLTRPLHPDWPAFAAAARRDLPAAGSPSPPDDSPLPLPGLWILDAEHNPAPLSPAHAGLIRRLTAERPELARMQVLAGWLYIPGRVQHVRPTTTTTELRRALDLLKDHHIPAARAALISLDTSLATADAPALATLVDRAVLHLQDVLATYAALPRPPRDLDTATLLLSLQGRGEHLDVLPATWDLASPTLQDLSFRTASPPTTSLDAATPGVLAVLLGELDDHLFALGLAPLRRIYLRAATLLGLAAADIFLLGPDELQAALRGRLTDLALARRRAGHDAHAELRPPLQLFDGLPVPAASDGLLRGIPIGPDAEGPLHLRRDLADLLADPPPAGAVLVMPALTAQAAVVLRALGVRAVCCEHGGALSHAALMARELGLSALIGCRGCTGLASGTHVRLDTRTGRLRARTTT